MIVYMSLSGLILAPEYDNSSVGEEEHFELRHLTSALCDWQVSARRDHG